MATYGRINEFVEEEEDWTQYVERMEHYFTANEVDDAEKKRAIFLSVCGSKIYKLLVDLLAPAKPKDKSFNELTTLVKNHLQPKPSEIVQRYKFHSCFRSKGQSISDFVALLRHLSIDCNFGDTLGPMLRDRLVCGVNDDRIQRRLLAEKDLDFDKALSTAKLMEQATKNVADLNVKEVNYMKQKGSRKPQKTGYKQDSKSEVKECFRCGGKNHIPSECYFKDSECFNCKGKGHTMKKCKKPKQNSGKQPSKGKKSNGGARQKYMAEEENEDETVYSFYKMKEQKESAIIETFNINGVSVPMEIDTGASKTVLSEKTSQELGIKYNRTHTKLRTYTGEKIPIIGESEVRVKYGMTGEKTLKVIIVEGNGPNLIGRDWLSEIRLNWQNLFHTKSCNEDEILKDFEDVFDGKLGKYTGVKAKIHVKEGAVPKYFKARSVPYALKEKISKELDRLEDDGTIERVQYSEWAAPIVPIVKSDQSIRICGDYKVTINPVSQIDNYPIPKTDDLFANLKGKYFSKLDLSNAYQQIELDEDSKQYTTINTHRGLYRYNRLCFGISSSPGIFQRVMDNILQGIQGVRVRVDDILIAGESVSGHNKILKEVLARLQTAGLKLKKSKCIFMAKEIVYLGHTIQEDGVKPLPDKVRAIEEMERPKNKKELQSFLGLINYYGRFLPNMSTVLASLYTLLKKGEQFKWQEEEENAWLESKKLLVDSKILVHFDQDKEIILACDASPYGVGAVLSHKMEDGSEHPIAFASRTLTNSEKNYAQIEKEGLAVVFGVKKFHQYLYGGKPFQIITDHKPLLGLFKEEKGTPTMASARIQRWSLLLGAYNYTLKHKPGACIGHADSLSRFPMQTTDTMETPVPGETILLMEHLETIPVTSKQIRNWTNTDPLLSKVKSYVQKGWPEKNSDNEMKPYFLRKSEISIVENCLLWGTRVIVPPKGRKAILNELHEGHFGMTKMKSVARSYVWWPKIDQEIEYCVKQCEICQVNNQAPGKAPLHSWEWPGRPWSRVHIDYAGPFMGKMFLIMVDAYSKWMEVFPTSSSTTSSTVELLRQSFATHGLPDTVVSDNGSCFTSEEFKEYMLRNGIRHIRSAPYHPSTNGLAERGVQTFKAGMKKQKSGSIQTKVSRFLFEYRTTSHSTTGQSPDELMFQRKIKSRLDLVVPDLRSSVEQMQYKQQKNRPCTQRNEFKAGDSVFVRNYSANGEKWLKGLVTEQTGPVSYKVRLSDESVVKKHLDQMKKCEDKVVIVEENNIVPPVVEVPNQEEVDDLNQPDFHSDDDTKGSISTSEDLVQKDKTGVITPRPQRERKIPAKFKDFVTNI